MIDIEALKKQYPTFWAVTDPNEVDFLFDLASRGIVSWEDYNEYSKKAAEVWFEPGFPLPEAEPPPLEPKVYDYIAEYPEMFADVDQNIPEFIGLLRHTGKITASQANEMYDEVSLYWQDVRQISGAPPSLDEQINKALWERVTEGVMRALKAMWISLGRYVREHLWPLVKRIFDEIKKLLGPPLAALNDKLNSYALDIYDKLIKRATAEGHITPERAPVVALDMYKFAFAAGLAAHASASLLEVLHPFKRLGVHQVSAMIGDFAAFGRIAAATIGVYATVALGIPMRYNVQYWSRPKIPDERLLIEFCAKREIDAAEFRKYMAYQGYSDYWSDIIYRWQWKDPRMLEIVRMADVGIDQGKPPPEEMPWLRRFGITGDKLKDWWLYRKYMRAGYEDCDLPVMVNFIHRRMASFAMTYVRTAIRRNYRWGFLSDKELSDWMDRLQLPEEAKTWIRWAGALDREYFYRQDLVRLYTIQYRNDLISADEFLVGLVAMGLPLREADITVRIEKARKSPKITRPVIKAAEKAMAEVQKKYVQLYIQQFRNDLITEEMLLQSLLAVGIEPELAEVTVALEHTKKFTPASPG